MNLLLNLTFFLKLNLCLFGFGSSKKAVTPTEQTAQSTPSPDVTPTNDAKSSSAKEKGTETSFFEKYKLYLIVGGVVALIGGYWYMSTGKKRETPNVNDSLNNKEPLVQENGNQF